MQDKLDKLLKQKLEGLSPEFKPAHWKQMESMLEDDGRKGFVWWPTLLAVFAFITVGAIGVYLVQSNGQSKDVQKLVAEIEQDELQPTATEHKALTEAEPPVSGENRPSLDERSLLPAFNEEEGGQASESNSRSSSLESPGSQSGSESKAESKRNSARLQTADRNETPSEASTEFLAVHAEAVPSARASVSAVTIATDPTSILINNAFSLGNNVLVERKQPIAVASVSSIQEAFVAPVEERVEDPSVMVEDDEIELPKLRTLSVSVGMTVGATESFIDNTRFSEPGYIVGPTIQVMYKNLFGLSTGLMYSNINYGTKNVICEDNSRYVCPLAYTSNIKALEIPIDLRLNFLRLKRWGFYASTGITNVIKLEESFGFQLPLQDTIPAQLPPSRNVPFNQSLSSTPSAQELYDETSTDFSLSDVERLHLTFNLSIGAEYRLSPKISLGLQPHFRMNLNQAGIQNKRLYTYGVNGKVNYIF